MLTRALAVCCAMLLLGASPIRRDTVGERITTRWFDGVVVYPAGKQESRHWWIPTRADVLEAEAALRAYVPRSNVRRTRVGRELSRYKRQYQPFRSDDGRQLGIVGFHESQVKDGTWLDQPRMVSGGGDYFFVASYSFRHKRIEAIRINAPK